MENFNEVIRLDEFINKNIISLDRGRVISSIDLNKKPGNHPVYSSSSQKNGLFGTFDEFDFDEELITWSVDGGGYFFYRPKHKFSVTNVSGILRILDKSKLDYKFLYYLLDFQHSNQLYDYVDKAHPSVIKKRYFIPEIEIVEQRKIADVFSKIDKSISQTEINIAKYNRIKTGLMQDLLTKGIDEKGNIRSEQTHEFKDSPIGRIPKDWDVLKLWEIGSKKSPYLKTGPFGSSLKTEHWVDEGIPVITIGSLGDDDFIQENLLFISEKKANELSAYKLIQDDILFSRVAEIGRSLVIKQKQSGWIMSSNFMRLRLDQNTYLSDFIYLLIKYSNAFQKQITENVNESGRSVTNSGILNSFIFPKVEINEQRKILEKINLINDFLNNLKIELNKLKSTKKGLMQDLLSGKKRVTHLIN